MAAAARLAGSAMQLGLETAIALAIGLLIGAVPEVRARLLPGASLAARYALRVGISLLGARLTLGQLLETGAESVAAIALTVVAALLLGTWLARRLAIGPPLSALITVGMAICGNSAILALSPIIGARHRETAYAVSTITIFGLIGVLLLPVVGRLLGLPEVVFGTWAGLAVNDTAQVVATGYAFSAPAGDVATVVKLTRNLAILPVLLGATWLVARRSGRIGRRTRRLGRRPRTADRDWRWSVGPCHGSWSDSSSSRPCEPPACWMCRSRPSGALADLCSVLASLLILVALAGVGMAADIRAMLGVGPRPFLLGATMWVAIGLFGLGAVQVYHD